MCATRNNEDLARFAKLGYEDFRRMASDESLSAWEKIGFPDNYRKGFEQRIFDDIVLKLPALKEHDRVVLDIGPGCSELPNLLIAHCAAQSHELLLVDSEEMLSLLPTTDATVKIPARFPDCPHLFEEYTAKIDALLCYSVFHYIFTESNVWRFVDQALTLLAPGGSMLLGDIPNVSKRKRFFASEQGARYHSAFVGRDEIPEVHFNRIEPDQIDDAVVMAVIARCRSAGFDAYVVAQDPALPMSNRREDILITRP